ncbi:MAG: hypothetical protein A2W91_09420 [Bacteroidetes bacterium GWF2_38_335]|nr:MAG: hypothetical protein A2W91_09420 [Bacteroidetes bacterium GWF2_38_335]OFY80812.1 MAG: hypothetical protein A2281_09080 [Bacteroidetes bacterium RIFOXYA12_FULL_38_20]HBS86213.1 hypothetical protein [Bacteroidales bacterium]
MKFYLAIIFFAFCFFANYTARTQNTGAVQIIVTYHDESQDKLFSLDIRDSVIQRAYFNSDHTFSGLTPGIYNIKVYNGFPETRLMTVYNVEVFSDSLTVCYLSYPEQYREELIDTVYESEGLAQVYLGLTYGISDKNNKGLIRDAFNLKLGMIAMTCINKHLALGGILGFYNYNHTRFLKDSSVFMPADHLKENYSYCYFPIGVNVSFSLNDMTKSPSKRIMLDLGATYNAPLWFRHSFKENNQTTLTRKIQKYNDFNAYCAFAVTPFSIWAEYRLTDFLKDGFPEMPRLNIGIVFLFYRNSE